MSLEQDVYSALSGLAGGRVYPLILPQVTTWPAITYQRISGVRGRTLTAPHALQRTRIQVDAWAETYAGAKALAGQIRTAMGVFTLAEVSDRDLYEDGPQLWRVTTDFIIWAPA